MLMLRQYVNGLVKNPSDVNIHENPYGICLASIKSHTFQMQLVLRLKGVTTTTYEDHTLTLVGWALCEAGYTLIVGCSTSCIEVGA